MARKPSSPPPAQDWTAIRAEMRATDPDRYDDHERLQSIEVMVVRLREAFDRGEDVSRRIRTTYSAIHGRMTDSDDRLALLDAIDRHASMTDADIIAAYSCTPEQLDTKLCELVTSTLKSVAWHVDLGTRVAEHPAEVAHAVRVWRRKGGKQPKSNGGETKFMAVAKVARLVGMAVVSSSAFEQTWKERPRPQSFAKPRRRTSTG